MNSPTYIDLFSGAGGLSTGFQDAGWKCLLATDWWPEAIDTFRLNHAHANTWCGDIRDLQKSKLSSLLPDKPDWVVGGPPCQGFSTIGKRQSSDPRNGLVREFSRVVRALRPNGFLLENVVGLRDMKFQSQVGQLFESIGYVVTCLVLRSADYGVPQLRHRVVFVGTTESLWFKGPSKTHRPDRYVSVWDAIGDLPPLAPGGEQTDYVTAPSTSFQKKMRVGSSAIQGHKASNHPDALVKAISFIPDGGNRFDIPDKYQPASGFHNSYSRLNSMEPAVAVTQNMGKPSGTRCIHPFQHRGLTAREGARLQSFPDRFHFVGGMIAQRLQIANAVPPMLARSLAKALANEKRWADTECEATGSLFEFAGDGPDLPESSDLTLSR